MERRKPLIHVSVKIFNDEIYEVNNCVPLSDGIMTESNYNAAARE